MLTPLGASTTPEVVFHCARPAVVIHTSGIPVASIAMLLALRV